MLSLADMRKAGGKQEKRSPNDWLSLASAKEFVGFVEANSNTEKSGVSRSRSRYSGGTKAYWQIAFAYVRCRPRLSVRCRPPALGVLRHRRVDEPTDLRR